MYISPSQPSGSLRLHLARLRVNTGSRLDQVINLIVFSFFFEPNKAFANTTNVS